MEVANHAEEMERRLGDIHQTVKDLIALQQKPLRVLIHLLIMTITRHLLDLLLVMEVGLL